MKRFQNHTDWLERKEEKNPQVPSRVSIELIACRRSVAKALWPAPGSADTELGVLMEPEVCHGETEVYTGVQA